ncbi:hypothetical protein ACUN8F_25210 [Citrobacter freundii]|uniref:hypothetical protein n=1 Tax=Citrobacter freundii TaxID=546 RepID=UPI004042C1CE
MGRNDLLIRTFPKGSNRIEVKLEFLASLEELPVGENLTTRLIAADVFNVQPCDPTRKDFFSICNKCFKQGVGIKVHMLDGRILIGETTGVNACQVGMIRPNGNHMQIMFDWVSRITSSDYSD